MEWTGTRTELPMGLYVLAVDGTLCVIGHENSLMPDTSLLEGLAEDISALLRAHAANPETPGLQVAVLYETPEARPRGKLAFSYEDQVLRDLYPVSQQSQDGLTTFQKKNRDKSLYRGMALLIEQRRDTAQNVPVYCPLLFDAGATLAERIASLGRTPTATATEARLQATDVLTLLAASVPAPDRARRFDRTLVQAARANGEPAAPLSVPAVRRDQREAPDRDCRTLSALHRSGRYAAPGTRPE